MAYSTITKPSLHFNTKLFTGTGSAQSITGVGFQPDWVWSKGRNSTNNHTSFDAVRGTGKALYQNLTNAEENQAQGITAFGTDGFSVGTLADINNSGGNIVSWNWKANGAGSSNTDGSITSTVSANTTAGFSIVSYTGTGSNATVGHGLGVAPKLIFIKNRDDAGGQSWSVYNKNLGNTKYLKLDTNSAEATNATRFNSTDPTSTVFSLGTHASGNASGEKIIAYCFADVKGYSKFGSYIGNGSTDGTFVYLGFKPAFVILKVAEHSASWLMFDNKRDGLNPNSHRVYANGSDAEDTGSGSQIDFLSNGFKGRSSDSSTNTINNKYLYMAFAEEPLVANVGASIPATAR